MGLTNRINELLLKRYSIFITLLVIAIAFLSILLPFYTITYNNAKLTDEGNPTIVNGILTVTAIVFGFVVFEWRGIRASTIEKSVLVLPLLLFLMLTLEAYFTSDVVGKTTKYTSLLATANCLFNILYLAPISIVKETHAEMRRRESPAFVT
jgi:hypothetical protein